MDQMKVSSAIRSYPDKFLLLQALKRNDSGMVELANVVGVYETKQEAFAVHGVLKLIGVNCFIVPTFDTDDSKWSETEQEHERGADLTPSENARIFRQYYGLD